MERREALRRRGERGGRVLGYLRGPCSFSLEIRVAQPSTVRQHTDNEIHFSHRRCRRRTTDVAAILLGFRVARWSFPLHTYTARTYVCVPARVCFFHLESRFSFSPASNVDGSYLYEAPFAFESWNLCPSVSSFRSL